MYFLTGRMSGLQSLSGRFRGDKNLLSLPGIEQRFVAVQPIVQSLFVLG